MRRIIAALYDTRSEAERARERLLGELRANSLRIISKDTAAALDGLAISRADAETYREALGKGSHLVVANVPIVDLLQKSASDDERVDERIFGEGDEGIRVEIAQESEEERPTEAAEAAPDATTAEEPAAPAPKPRVRETVEEERIPIVQESLKVGKRMTRNGGTRVRSHVRENPAEEQVTLREEKIEVENRPCERTLSNDDAEAGGLFEERVFEIAQMREEPVVTKVAVVREEVIVRKRIQERVETVRDTVRRTEVEVDDLPVP
jgi:uncharacterized protein (TIGR02271 family)